MPTARSMRGWRNEEMTTMRTARKYASRNALWLSAALLLMVAACGEQGGEQAEETPPATTEQQ